MFNRSLPRIAGLILGISFMMAVPASADPLKDEIAPTGKLRVAIGISTAGGAFWSTKTEAGGYAGVPVDLGKAMAAQLGVPVEYVPYPEFRDRSPMPRRKATGTSPSCRRMPSARPICVSGRSTRSRMRPTSSRPARPSRISSTLDQPGIKVAAVNNTTTMRGALAHLKNAKVTGYQTYDEIFSLVEERRDRRVCAVARPAQRDGEEDSGNARAGRDLQADRYGAWRCRSTIRSRWPLRPNS